MWDPSATPCVYPPQRSAGGHHPYAHAGGQYTGAYGAALELREVTVRGLLEGASFRLEPGERALLVDHTTHTCADGSACSALGLVADFALGLRACPPTDGAVLVAGTDVRAFMVKGRLALALAHGGGGGAAGRGNTDEEDEEDEEEWDNDEEGDWADDAGALNAVMGSLGLAHSHSHSRSHAHSHTHAHLHAHTHAHSHAARLLG